MKRILLLVLIVAVIMTAVFLTGCNNKESVINSIEIYTKPTTVYLQGERLSLNGAQLLVKYDNNSEEFITITDDMVSGYNENLLGEQFLTVTYKGKIVSLPIKIVSPQLVSIDINTLPTKVNYIQGQLFSISGCKINVDYVGGVTKVIDVTEEMCNLDVIDMDEVGTQVVTVSYSLYDVERTATFNINIVPKVLQSMQISQSPTKKIYYVGEELDLTDGEIFFAYSNGYPEKVNMAALYNNGQSNLSIQWDNTTIAGRSVVSLTYNYQDPTSDTGEIIAYKSSFDVTVTERDITSVEILSAKDDYRYQLINMPINLSGLILRVTYNNGTSEVVSFTGDETDPQDRIQVEGYNSSGIEYLGYQVVKLVFFYSGVRLKTTYDLGININNRAPSGIRIILPAGTIYDNNGIPCFYQDTPIYPFANSIDEISGWKYVVQYDNGTEQDTEFTLVSSMVKDTMIRNGIYYQETGLQTWYLRYIQVDNIPFTFKILPKQITRATIQLPANYKTYFGFDLNVQGMMLDLQYNNGDNESIYVTPSMVKEFSKNILGEQRIKLSYSNKYTGEQGIEVDGRVTVVKKVKENYSIGFRTLPQVNYIRDSALDLSRAEITIQYDEGGLATTEIVSGMSLATNWIMLPTPLIEGGVTFRNSEGWTVTTFNITPNWKFNKLGAIEVFISYEGLTSFENGAGFTVTVTDPVDTIELEDEISNVISGQELNLTDINLRIKYESGRFQFVPVTRDMVNYNSRDLRVGTRAVKITYKDPSTSVEFTIEVNIEVSEKVLESMKVINPPRKTEYLYSPGSVGDSIDIAGLKIMFNYNNGTSEIVEVTDDNMDDFLFENFATDTQTESLVVTVIYIYNDNIFDTFTVAVRDVVVSGLKWIGGSIWPVVTSEEGKDFDMIQSISDYQIEVAYSDGENRYESVQFFANQLNVVGYNRNTAIRQNISLVYKQNPNIFLKLEVNVIPRVLFSINLMGSKGLEVIENNDIDLSEFKLTLNYSNDTQEIVSMIQSYIVKSASNPGGYDKNDTRIGSRPVTISYVQNGVRCTYNTTITVKAKQLISIGINSLPKIKYIEGEELDLTGGKVALYYDNGSQEELAMTDATTESFYINRNKFDNNEFSGVAKLQTIYIIYKSAGQDYQTHFDIIMQDRRMPTVVFDPQNIYEFVYGNKQAPAFTIYGYGDYYQEETNMAFNAAKLAHVTVKYINVNEYNTQDPSKDYTILPSEAGSYYIIVSYNADPSGYTRDSVHNSFIYISPRTLVITKKVVYVGIDNIEKIYGTTNPNNKIYIISEEKYRNPTIVNDKPFAYNDNFFSAAFIRSVAEQSYCYDKDNNLITSFLVHCIDRSGNPIDIKTAVGNYQLSISMGSSVSDNYDIRFIGNHFIVKPRDVLVTPINVIAEYGDRNITYRYTVSGRAGDPASGLYGTDILTGSLSRNESGNYNVGKYAITKGTLANSNYNVIFINDTVSDGGNNGVYLTIYKRNLYIKINSQIITYGDAVPNLSTSNITLYRNDVCTITQGALASTDTFEMLLGATGRLTFTHGLTALSSVGRYNLTVSITGVTTASVIQNYEIHYIAGYIEVKPKVISVKAISATKIYGDADPALSYTVTGTLPSGVLQGNVARQQGEHIGNYAITIGTLSSSNPNYIINFSGASFVITSKVLVARIDSANLTKVFDGKIPTPPSFTVYQIVNGQELPVSEGVDTSFISVSILEARRDSGSYNLNIHNSNTNYSVSFPAGVSYKYIITKRSVDVEIIIPQNLPYKGSGYVFDAYVPDNQIQRFYNSNGSVMVDEDNNEIKDEISVVLQFTTGSTAVFVGNYEVYVSALISQNDNYQVRGMISKTFSITPRELVVTMNPSTLSYGDTIEVDFSDRTAAIRSSDYTLSNRIEGSSDIINFSFRIVSTAHGLDSAKNVIFNPDGTVGSYDIVVVQPSNANYSVKLAAPYKYKIIPRNVKIRITNNFLSKRYDGNAPEIIDFSKVATLAKNDVVFTFTRDTNDGRPLGDVGVYNMSVSSKDPNHTVYLESTYQYTITKSSVTISPKKDSKSYDGMQINMLYQDLTVSTFKGLTPVIRSFASTPIYEGDVITGYTDVADVFNNFQFVMSQMITMFSKNIEKANSIIFSDMSLAMLRVNETSGIVQEALNYLNDNSNVIQTPGRLNLAIQSLTLAKSYLNAISPAATPSSNENNLYLAKENINAAFNVIEAENTYIAFLFRPVGSTGADGAAINAGNYIFEIKQNDFNKEYIYNSTLYTYRVLPKEVYLGVNTYSKMYGTITANPTLGDQDYYDYETKVLIEGQLVEMTLPNFNPRFTRTNPTSFNVGIYTIIYQPDTLLDNNYVILEDRTNYTWSFSITPATIILQIGDTGYDQNKIEYGIRISNTIVDRWSYVSGLSDNDKALVTIEGQVSLEALKTHIINTNNVNYSVRKKLAGGGLGEDVIYNVASRPSAGDYNVSASGFSATNYNFEVLSGNLKISKADIFINTDFNGNVSRVYGDALILTFGGLKYEDYINITYNYNTNSYLYNTYLGEDGGIFTMPLFRYNPEENINNINPYAFTTPATNEGYYSIYFEWTAQQAEQLKNYNMTKIVDNSSNPVQYGMLVSRANLAFSIANAANTSQYPSTIYGEIPDVVYIYQGFKNNEDQFILGFQNPDCSSLSLRNVWDSKQITLQDIVFSEESLNKLSNYNLIMDPNANLTVNKRTLYVHLDKSISVQYQEDFAITPYISLPIEEKNAKISGGQYGYWNIQFENKPYKGTANPKAGLANNENPEDIFQRYLETDGYLTFDAENNVYTFYLFYQLMVKHELEYAKKVGENVTIKLKNLVFTTPGENYSIIYDETPLNVYGKLTSFVMDEERIVLNGDNINNLSVTAVYEDSTQKSFTIQALKNLSNATVQTTAFPSDINKNRNVTITFNRTYSLTNLDRTSVVVKEPVLDDNGEIVIVDVTYNLSQDNSFIYQFNNGAASSTISTRVYDLYDANAPVPMPVTFTGYTYRNLVNAAGYTEGNQMYLNAANKDFDYLDTTIRMVPSSAAHGFSINIAGGVTSGTSSLLFTGKNTGVYQIVMGTPAKTYNIDLGAIDLFDGYSHNIRVYFNKQYKMVYIFIDGYACSAISVSEFVFDSNESNKQSIGFYGVQAWVRHFVTGYKGYYDRIATQIEVAENIPLTYYLAESNIKELSLDNILASSGVPKDSIDPKYTKKYYINGVETHSGIHNFVQGSYKIEMVILDGESIVDRRSVTVYITYAYQSASISEIVGNNSVMINNNITQSNPVEVKSFTPNASNSNLIDNVLQEFHTYNIGGSNNVFSSVSLSLKMTVAMMASTGRYRGTANAKNFVVLWGNNTSYAPGYSATPSDYYGIGLSYEYNSTNNYQSTNLYVAFGATQYYEQIDGIDWLSGNEYTVSLYVDKKNSNDYGGSKVKLVIYRGATPVYSTSVGTGYQMNGGTVTQTQMAGLISASAKTSIISADTIIAIRKAQFNAENKTTNDYIINGTYSQSGYSGVDVSGNSNVYISDNNGNYSLNKMGESSVKFQFSGAASADTVNFKFIIASSNTDYTYANSVYVEYSGVDRILYFYFVENGTVYKKQVLKSDINLVDGRAHTIVATTNFNKYQALEADLNNLLASRSDVSQKVVNYQTWQIFIDGEETIGIMPYYNSTYYWIRDNGTNSIGQQPPQSGDTFMDNYIYCGLSLTNAPIKLYALESRGGRTSEYNN